VEQSNFDRDEAPPERNHSSSSFGSGKNSDIYSVPHKPGGSSVSPSTPTRINDPRRNKSRYDDDSDEAPDFSFGLTDESDTDSDDKQDNKGTLGKMLKKKRGEILSRKQ
jgi:hypothetical protein